MNIRLFAIPMLIPPKIYFQSGPGFRYDHPPMYPFQLWDPTSQVSKPQISFLKVFHEWVISTILTPWKSQKIVIFPNIREFTIVHGSMPVLPKICFQSGHKIKYVLPKRAFPTLGSYITHTKALNVNLK